MSKYTNYHRPSKCPNVVGIFLLAFACFLISVIKNFSYPQKLPELDYKIYDSELFPLAVPSKLVVANNTIAVFFEDVGYLSCYSIEGTFLYGIQVDTSLNGRGNFAAVNDMWVIYTKKHSLYIFSGKDLVRKCHMPSASTAEWDISILSELGNPTANSCEYEGRHYILSFDGSTHIVESYDTIFSKEIVTIPPNQVGVILFWSLVGLCSLGSVIALLKKK